MLSCWNQLDKNKSSSILMASCLAILRSCILLLLRWNLTSRCNVAIKIDNKLAWLGWSTCGIFFKVRLNALASHYHHSMSRSAFLKSSTPITPASAQKKSTAINSNSRKKDSCKTCLQGACGLKLKNLNKLHNPAVSIYSVTLAINLSTTTTYSSNAPCSCSSAFWIRKLQRIGTEFCNNTN